MNYEKYKSEPVKRFVKFFNGEVEITKENEKEYEKEITLQRIFNIYRSDLTKGEKQYRLCKLFKNSEMFENKYRFLLKYREDEFLRKYVAYVEKIAADYRRLDDNNLRNEIMEAYVIEDYKNDYCFARYHIEGYIETSEFEKSKILEKLDIDGAELEYYEKVIEALDKSLYSDYQKKKYNNMLLSNSVLVEKLNNLYEGITTGYINGEEFNDIELAKNLPFYGEEDAKEALKNLELKGAPNYSQRLKKVLEYVCPEKKDVIFKYLIGKKLANGDNILKEAEFYRTGYIIGGREITDNDKDIIVNFIKDNNLPPINFSYRSVIQKHLDGTLKKNKTLTLN